MRSLLSFAAVAIAVGCAAYTSLGVAPRPALLILGGAAVALLILGLATARWWLATPAVGLLMASYGVALVIADRPLDLLSPLIALGLFCILELFDMSSMLAHRRRVEPRVLDARVAAMAVIGGSAVVAGSAALLAGALVPGGHPLLLILGAGAGLLAVAVAVTLVRRAVTR